MSTEASFRLHGDASHAQMWRWWRAGLHARQANPRAQTRYSSDDEGTTSRRRTSRVANASLSRPHKRCARHPMVGKGAVVGPPRLGHRRSLYSCAALLLLLQMPRSARSYEGRIGFSFMKAASTTRQSCEGPQKAVCGKCVPSLKRRGQKRMTGRGFPGGSELNDPTFV